MTPERVIALIQSHVTRYPLMDVQDVYKLLHQSVFGPGHSIPNKKAAREWLEQEAGLCTPNKAEPLFESVHPEHELVRVNLRPYLAVGGRLPNLLDAYIRSAEAVNGNAAQMAEYWAIFAGEAKAGKFAGTNIDTRLIALTGRTRAAENWPAIHHSPAYARQYKPIYRVLIRAQVDALGRQQSLDLTVI
jgi:hypothetical protein